MTPLIQSFVLHFGEMGSRWGINRTVGQIYALLMLSQAPLNAEYIAQSLEISRSNVSVGLKELQSWRLVKLQHQPGDRKEYYSLAGDTWDMALRVMEERRKREIDPTLAILDALLKEPVESIDDQYAQSKMQQVQELLSMLSQWSNDLQSLSPESLQRLMQLGAGVNRLLELKDKLLGK
ncbi:MAG TPA: MarR family transcriptional regulator [Cellvibrionaceae bacterium]